jgi:hypothetical protein
MIVSVVFTKSQDSDDGERINVEHTSDTLAPEQMLDAAAKADD